ncbi:birA, biotin-(acetyl-CoA-carboxylase) ligase [Metallosphaera yellowstonensis MK1]|uniref:BirA, biotin-(Acetyl-CoA-carboxylase) ligase n=1 Tax=Metallosphaera yellowstonensis MK1 TaxID=671065 RepID=H2C960_9CREN|nr:biotin--[acetyl-CoA-carboxylase] ligase [Metallosphaera yellowstonensis]EHP68686.1 birA, biotin-(acetyl-CoA-carboxylase) ligase [Metallosphaera yellowstonensis MK1]
MQRIKLDVVTSTQDLAEAIHHMIPGDFVVTAEEQTRARGRYGRDWYSPRGGLWVTYVKKGFGVEEINVWTLRVSLAIRASISNYVEAMIRWPNDLVVNDKKISGVLLEALVEGNCATGFIGFGVNTNVEAFPPEIKATSILLETGKKVDNDQLLWEILREVEKYASLDQVRVIEELNKFLSIKEREVVIRGRDWEKTCTSLFVDKFGRLVTECGIFEVEDVLRLESK